MSDDPKLAHKAGICTRIAPSIETPHPQEVINYLNECIEAQSGAWPLVRVSISKSVVDDIISLLALPQSVSAATEPDGYAVLLDDRKGETPGNCGYWYVGAYRTEAAARNVAERGKQGARVVPLFFKHQPR